MAEKIAGIYNYCDRWCERCTFTTRCAAYEDETDLTPEERDMQNQAFWDRIGKNFHKAQEILQKAAQHFGVDLDLPEKDPEAEKKKERIRSESREHPLATLTFEYAAITGEWLKTQPGMLDRLDTLRTGLTLGVESTEGARRETVTIKDSLSIIRWYMHLIHAKAVRALMGRMADSVEESADGLQRDCDGSAKVALIAVARSMQAWSSLFEILPEQEDHFLKILSMLEKIRSMVKREFPEAEAFVRPGFDDQPATPIN